MKKLSMIQYFSNLQCFMVLSVKSIISYVKIKDFYEARRKNWLSSRPGKICSKETPSSTGRVAWPVELSSFPENGTVLQKGCLESGRKFGSWKLFLQQTCQLTLTSKTKNKKGCINIVQIVVPPTPLNKSKCKNFNELQKFEELLVSIVIIIKKLMDLYFQKLLKFPKKVQTINAQCNNTWQKVTRFIAELKKLSSYSTKWYHKFSSKFCICIYSKLTNT